MKGGVKRRGGEVASWRFIASCMSFAIAIISSITCALSIMDRVIGYRRSL